MEYCKDNYCVKGERIEYKEKLIDAPNYHEYLEMVYALLEENKSGENTSDSLIHYTRMNMKRMERWNKTASIQPELFEYVSSIESEIEFLVITEAWCGDAAHVLPIVHKLVEFNSKFSMKVLMRDEHPEIMDKYLTNGSRSIPVVIGLQKIENDYLELFKWGPKPMPMMEKLHAFKSGDLNISKGLFLKETQIWYNEDKANTIQNELKDLMKEALVL